MIWLGEETIRRKHYVTFAQEMATIVSQIALGDQEPIMYVELVEDPPSDLVKLAASFPSDIRDRNIRLDRILQERRLRAGSKRK